MKAKNGISLIVLVITIVVIIILAAAVILSLGDNNPINSSRVASLTQTRDNIESAVTIYLSNQFTKYAGEYSSAEIITGKRGEDAIPVGGATTITPLVDVDDEIENGAYKINNTDAKDLLGVEIPSTETWYLSTSGKAYIKYTAIPSYLMDSDAVNVSVAGFVTTK